MQGRDFPNLEILGVQMTRKGDGRPLAIASKRRPGVCRTTVLLLLVYAFAALHNTAVEGRSLKASTPGPYILRHLQSIDLPAGDQGWTLGRASYNNPTEKFNNTFVPAER